MVLRKHELEGKLGEERRMINSGILRDENPLDQGAAFESLLAACRLGDLRRCQELINQGVNINAKDAFDYTPLIIASLCGHFDLVRLLLESGALAERNTFQGERCIYNALNDRIRNLLLEYDFSKTSDPYRYWAAHISDLPHRTEAQSSDLSLDVGWMNFRLHKFLLAIRAPAFCPDAAGCAALTALPYEAMYIAVRHVYLDTLPHALTASGGTPEDEERVARGLDRVTGLLGIPRLWEAFLAGSSDRRLARQRCVDEEKYALKQFDQFLRHRVLAKKITLDAELVSEVRLGYDNDGFADVLLRADEPPPVYDNDDDDDDDDDGGGSPPVILNAQGIPIGVDSDSHNHTQSRARHRPKAVLYPAHKAMLVRSPYFQSMFAGRHYLEAQPLPHLRVVTVDCSPPVLELVLAYLYTESVACPLEHALDLLYAADMLLLDGLKNKAAVAISTLGSNSGGGNGTNNSSNSNSKVDSGDGGGGQAHEASTEPVNIYDVITAAWDLGVPRLEEFAARYLADRLELYIDDSDFHNLIRASAARLRGREETDSIELLDDIRYYLSERFRLRFEDAHLDALEEGGDEDEGDVKAAATAAATAPATDTAPATATETETAHAETAPTERAPTETAQVQSQQHANKDRQNSDESVVPEPSAQADPGEQEVDEDDDFASHALNYHVLLGKIDDMLASLNLDA